MTMQISAEVAGVGVEGEIKWLSLMKKAIISQGGASN